MTRINREMVPKFFCAPEGGRPPSFVFFGVVVDPPPRRRLPAPLSPQTTDNPPRRPPRPPQPTCPNPSKPTPDGPDAPAVEIDFTPPWRRISMVSGLEEALGVKLPGDLDSEETRAVRLSLRRARTLTFV